MAYTFSFYKNIKTEGSLWIFLVLFSFKPKNVLNMFLFSKYKDALAWRICSKNSNCTSFFLLTSKTM